MGCCARNAILRRAAVQDLEPIQKFAAAEAEEAAKPASSNGTSRSEEPAAGGSLASDAQLAALREKLAGNA